jgi:hypothetical protein
MSLVDAKEALSDKDKEIESLKRSFEVRASMVKGDGGYSYFVGDGGKPIGYPVCPSCDLDGRVVQLKQHLVPVQARCPRCKTEFRPISCYLPSGAGDVTLHEQERRRTNEAFAGTAARLGRLNRGIA